VKSLYHIITDLQNTSSNITKKKILDDNKENTLLKKYLKTTYDPTINFYITEKTFPNATPDGDFNGFPLDICMIDDTVDFIANRKLTGNEAKNFIANTIEGLLEVSAKLYKWMLLKDIKAGVSVSTINKIWPRLIFEQPYMRCSLPNAVKLSEWDWKNGVYSQLKCDGMFASITDKQAITRNGSTFPFDLLPTSFKKEMRNIPDGVTLNGELLVKRNGVVLSRKEGNGMLNSLLQGTALQDDCELHYVAWDIEDYSLPYTDRFIEVLAICDGEYFNHVEYKMVYSLEQATQHFKEMLSQGQEGTVLKNPNGMWKDGTSKDCVKYKVEAEIDMKVVGVVEGTGKYKGMLGALQLESECGLVKTDCGTGFSDKQRKVMLDNPPKIVAIKANDLVDSKSKEGYSLFLPVFLEERVDKSVADNIGRIREIFDSEKDM
jgi:DNA ligase-1